MKRIILFILTAVAAVSFTACTPTTPSNTNTNTNAVKTTAPAPTKEALVALETKAFEAWKNKDGKFFEGFLADNFVMLGEDGKRMGKAETIKMIVENKCEMKSFALSESQMTMAGADVAVLTSKAAEDYTCEGKKAPPNWWVASVYVRSGSEWKGVYHGEIPAGEPAAANTDKADANKDAKSEKAPPPPPAKDDKSEKAAPPPPAKDDKSLPPPTPVKSSDTKPSDPTTDALLAAVKKGWEAWKNRDAKGLGDAITNDFVLIDPMGNRYDRAGALKAWTEPKCDIKSFSLTEPNGMSLSKDAGLITLKGTAEGTCEGEKLGALWGTYVLVKEGENWKAAMIFETPAS